MKTKNTHLTYSDRQIIETGIYNGSQKTAIAKTLGKDNSTIGKEIKLHRTLISKCPLPLECSNYSRCRFSRLCTTKCPDYKAFKCKRRDRSPGACNGCDDYQKCRFNKYKYSATNAQNNYEEVLKTSREGIDCSLERLKEIGNIIKPLIDKGQSLSVIVNNHPELGLSEKTLYNYLDLNVFRQVGISISNIDLPRKVSRRYKLNDKKITCSPRQDRKYLIGRSYDEYLTYIQDNPNDTVVEMDTVYNNISDGPFIQTFKFKRYDLLFCIFHKTKTSKDMLDGINLLENILGKQLFEKEVKVLLTDRGSEFVLADETEIRSDGTRRTRIYYCDSMASWQKGSLENIHILLRKICPKECDLYNLGLTSQSKVNIVSSHINSYPKEKLNNFSSFQLLEFMSNEVYKRFIKFGLVQVEPDKVTLKPYILK